MLWEIRCWYIGSVLKIDAFNMENLKENIFCRISFTFIFYSNNEIEWKITWLNFEFLRDIIMYLNWVHLKFHRNDAINWWWNFDKFCGRIKKTTWSHRYCSTKFHYWCILLHMKEISTDKNNYQWDVEGLVFFLASIQRWTALVCRRLEDGNKEGPFGYIFAFLNYYIILLRFLNIPKNSPKSISSFTS